MYRIYYIWDYFRKPAPKTWQSTFEDFSKWAAVAVITMLMGAIVCAMVWRSGNVKGKIVARPSFKSVVAAVWKLLVLVASAVGAAPQTVSAGRQIRSAARNAGGAANQTRSASRDNGGTVQHTEGAVLPTEGAGRQKDTAGRKIRGAAGDTGGAVLHTEGAARQKDTAGRQIRSASRDPAGAVRHTGSAARQTDRAGRKIRSASRTGFTGSGGRRTASAVCQDGGTVKVSANTKSVVNEVTTVKDKGRKKCPKCNGRKYKKSATSPNAEEYYFQVNIDASVVNETEAISRMNDILNQVIRHKPKSDTSTTPISRTPAKRAVRFVYVPVDKLKGIDGTAVHEHEGVLYRKVKSARQYVEPTPSVDTIRRQINSKKAIKKQEKQNEIYDHQDNNAEFRVEGEVKRVHARKYKYSSLPVSSRGTKIPAPIHAVSQRKWYPIQFL